MQRLDNILYNFFDFVIICCSHQEKKIPSIIFGFNIPGWGGGVSHALLPGYLRSADDYIKTFLILLWAIITPLLQFIQPVPYWQMFQLFLIFYICHFLFLPKFLWNRFLELGLQRQKENV